MVIFEIIIPWRLKLQLEMGLKCLKFYLHQFRYILIESEE